MMKRTGHIYTVILTLVFLAWILVPFLNDSLQFYSEPSVSKRENRNLARKPFFNISLLDPYPALYTNYYTDHFVFRQHLLKAHSFLNFFCFNRSPVPDEVDIGKNGWLYFGLKDREIYQGKLTLPADKVNAIVRELHRRAEYYGKRGIRFYVCFAPMKQEIYPEYLPNNYFRAAAGTQTDKVVAAIRKDPGIAFIDLKSALLDSKKYGQVYQKTDHHWDFRGSYYVYSAIMERIRKDFPAVKPLTLDDVVFNKPVPYNGTLANMIGFAEELKGKVLSPTIRNARAIPVAKAGYTPPYWFSYKDEYEIVFATPDTTMPKLFVIRDSFFTGPMIFLRENFRKTVAIWDAWMYGPNKEQVAQEKPDLVLLMVYEQNIGNILMAPLN
jgi:alginate O-acetyltransferase complex protein AlgJ